MIEGGERLADPSRGAANYNYALAYLRGFLVVLVVAHHAMLAYHPFAPDIARSLVALPHSWQAFPIVDSHKWFPTYFLVDFNERFFMSLMFFLSGLFVWNGMTRKGVGQYLRDRLRRLGLPFLVAAGVVAPIAYYPAYLQIAEHSDNASFWSQWLSLRLWPAGPAWFLWVLLAFDGIAALLILVFPTWATELGEAASAGFRKPLPVVLCLLAVSLVVYLPSALVFNTARWTAFGPFAFQTSRLLLYLTYFLCGIAIGAWGLGRGLLAPRGELARRWPWWLSGALAIYSAGALLMITALTAHPTQQGWVSAADCGFVLSCAALSFAFLSLFLRFVTKRVPLLDSLSSNSYAIYIVHYGFVTWLQYALLHAAFPAFAKLTVVFLGALAASWMVAATIRRIPTLARVI